MGRTLGMMMAAALGLASAIGSAARADELAACGVSDGDYANAVQAIAAAGYRDQPLYGLFAGGGEPVMRRLMDQVTQEPESGSDFLAALLGTIGDVMILSEIADNPPRWQGDRRSGESRIGTIEKTMSLMAMLRKYSHRVAPPPALGAVAVRLATCDAAPQGARASIAQSLLALAQSPTETRLYAGDAGAADLNTAIKATFGGYPRAQAATMDQARSFITLAQLGPQDVCQSLQSLRGGENPRYVEQLEQECGRSLVGGGVGETSGLFGFADLSERFFPTLKVAGAAGERGGQRIADPVFAETVTTLVQLQQPMSVDAVLRVLALDDGPEGRAIREALDRGWSNNAMTPDDMVEVFKAGLREFTAEEKAAEEADRRLNAAVYALWRKRPDQWDQLQSFTASLGDIQSALRPDEAIVILDHSAFAPTTIAVTADGVFGGNADISLNTLAGHVAAVTGSITDFTRSSRGAFPAADAKAVHDAVIAPVSEAVAGKRRLFVVANADAAPIPFDALVPEIGPDGRAASYLIDQAEVVLIPSLNALINQRRTGARAPAQPRTFAAFSDPAFAPAPAPPPTVRLRSLAASFGEVATPCALPRVPATAEVARTLARRFSPAPGADLRGADATEAAVGALSARGAFQGVDIVAFNTHGLLAGQVPAALGNDPALALMPSGGDCDGAAPRAADPSGDGFLTAAEIYALRIPAPIVMLTACNTIAAGAVDATAPLTGLARAFFAAGAQSIVVSQWEALVADAGAVDPGPTEMFVDALFAETAAAPSFAGRMRDAKLAVRATYPHPAAWAVFALVGTGD